MTDVGITSPDELGVVVSINYILDCLPAWHGFDTAYLYFSTLKMAIVHSLKYNNVRNNTVETIIV